jgi:hypothetical protein
MLRIGAGNGPVAGRAGSHTGQRRFVGGTVRPALLSGTFRHGFAAIALAE